MSYGTATPRLPRAMAPSIGVGKASLAGFAMLATASWAYILFGGDSGLADLFRAQGLAQIDIADGGGERWCDRFDMHSCPICS